MVMQLVGRARRHIRVRKKVHGSAARPRLCVNRSEQHIYAQLVDDDLGVTLAAAGSTAPELREQLPKKGRNVEAAAMVGKLIAERARAKNIQEVVFDRAGYKYHGLVKKLAEAAREAGLKF